MKIKLTRRKGSASISFKAENDEEGVDLKDAVLAMGKGIANPDQGGVERLIEKLGVCGYEANGITEVTRNVREFTVKRKRERKP